MIVNLFAHVTYFCTSRCMFCYQKEVHTSRTYMPLHVLEDALAKYSPQWTILLGGEVTLTAFNGWHGPKLHDYIAVIRRSGSKVAVQTAGIHLKQLPNLHELVDKLTISMDYVSTLKNVTIGRWNNGTTLQDILDYATQHKNVEFTSVYLGENLADVLTIAEWSLRNNRQYLIKANKSALIRLPGESMEKYLMRLEDVKKDMTSLFRSIYMLHLAYNVDPYTSPIMVEEPSYIVFLNEMTQRNVKTYCPAALEMLSILPDGTVTPCPLGLMFNYKLKAVFKPELLYSVEPPTCLACTYHEKYGCNGCPAMGNVARICPMYRENPDANRAKKLEEHRVVV